VYEFFFKKSLLLEEEQGGFPRLESCGNRSRVFKLDFALRRKSGGFPSVSYIEERAVLAVFSSNCACDPGLSLTCGWHQP
jgi:hypothetical protein